MNEIGLVPLIRYRDLTTAVHWLCQTFGFKVRHVVKAQDGSIEYAELSYGRGLVMAGPVKKSEFQDILKQPHDIQGINTQCCYVALNEVQSHYNHASQSGAEIVLKLCSDANGELAYSARDPEGHLWSFGSYSPWEKSQKKINKSQGWISPTHRSVYQFAASITIFVLLAFLLSSYSIYKKPLFILVQHLAEITTSETEKKLQDLTLEDTLSKEQQSSRPQDILNFTSPKATHLENETVSPSHSQKLTPTAVPNLEILNGQKEGTQSDLTMETPGNAEFHKHKSSEDKRANNLSILEEEPKETFDSPPTLPQQVDQSITGSLGEQSSENPKLPASEPLPAVTVAPSLPDETKTPRIKKSQEVKKIKSRLPSPKVIPATTKRKVSQPTDISPYFLFD